MTISKNAHTRITHRLIERRKKKTVGLNTRMEYDTIKIWYQMAENAYMLRGFYIPVHIFFISAVSQPSLYAR